MIVSSVDHGGERNGERRGEVRADLLLIYGQVE